jgi:hypothetical protein
MVSSACWRTDRSFSRVIGDGGLFPSCLYELPTGDPGAEERMGYKRLLRLVDRGKLLLSLLDEEVGRSVVCFIMLGMVNINAVFESEIEVVGSEFVFVRKA